MISDEIETDKDLWSSEFVEDLLASQIKSPIGQLVKRWRESWLEVDRLTERLELLSDDRVMSSRVRNMRADQENACRLYADRITETRARNATDLAWKLLVAAESKPGTEDALQATRTMAKSAFYDLIHFIRKSENTKGAKT